MALLGVILAVMASLVASAGNGRRVNDQVNQRATTIETVANAIERHLEALCGVTPADLRHHRREKYLHMGRELE